MKKKLNLKAWRKRMGVTQEQAAELLGYSGFRPYAKAERQENGAEHSYSVDRLARLIERCKKHGVDYQ